MGELTEPLLNIAKKQAAEQAVAETEKNTLLKNMGVSEILCKSNRESRHYAIFKVTYTKKFTQSKIAV